MPQYSGFHWSFAGIFQVSQTFRWVVHMSETSSKKIIEIGPQCKYFSWAPKHKHMLMLMHTHECTCKTYKTVGHHAGLESGLFSNYIHVKVAFSAAIGWFLYRPACKSSSIMAPWSVWTPLCCTFFTCKASKTPKKQITNRILLCM